MGSAEKRLRLAAGSRPAELTSLRQQDAGVRRDSLRGPRRPADSAGSEVGGRSCQGALKEQSWLFGFHGCF